MSHKLEIQLSDRCFEVLLSYCEQNSQSPSVLIEQLLSQTLHFVPLLEDSPEIYRENSNQLSQSQQLIELEERLSQTLTDNLTTKLTQLIYQTIDARLDKIQTDQVSPKPNIAIAPTSTSLLPVDPPIHQLQIGDLVQIRDPDSNYFSQIMPIVSVGMIRVTVETPTGAASFLKRDLRFQRP